MHKAALQISQATALSQAMRRILETCVAHSKKLEDHIRTDFSPLVGELDAARKKAAMRRSSLDETG